MRFPHPWPPRRIRRNTSRHPDDLHPICYEPPSDPEPQAKASARSASAPCGTHEEVVSMCGATTEATAPETMLNDKRRFGRQVLDRN